MSDIRINKFKEKINIHKPKLVVMYGWTKRKQFMKIIDKKENEMEKLILKSGKKDRIVFYCKLDDAYYFITDHPTARGITNEYWHDLGRFIRKTVFQQS